MRRSPVMLGLFRTVKADGSEWARVRWAAGDAAPYLSRQMYQALHFAPPYETLPARSDFILQHEDFDPAVDQLNLRCPISLRHGAKRPHLRVPALAAPTDFAAQSATCL